jgi:hypothetical protein
MIPRLTVCSEAMVIWNMKRDVSRKMNESKPDLIRCVRRVKDVGKAGFWQRIVRDYLLRLKLDRDGSVCCVALTPLRHGRYIDAATWDAYFLILLAVPWGPSRCRHRFENAPSP